MNINASKAMATPAPQVAVPPVRSAPASEPSKTATPQDKVEISDQAANLLQSRSDSGKPISHPSQWSQDRAARLDQLELLVQKGQYHIEPFMVDEIALRLARSMVSA